MCFWRYWCFRLRLAPSAWSASCALRKGPNNSGLCATVPLFLRTTGSFAVVVATGLGRPGFASLAGVPTGGDFRFVAVLAGRAAGAAAGGAVRVTGVRAGRRKCGSFVLAHLGVVLVLQLGSPREFLWGHPLGVLEGVLVGSLQGGAVQARPGAWVLR